MDAFPPAPPDSAGELIVHNGRQSGARKALGNAFTLVGRTEGCDVRLNVDGVHPVHCAIVRGPDGVLLRTLHGATTHLNGEAISEAALHNGDLIAVGPFQFRIALAPLPERLDPSVLLREKDALRIQAAAVAAQQTALAEEESRLQHRRTALERQESQLSTHLEERRRKLVELQDQVREARMALRNERAEHEKRLADTTTELLNSRRSIAAAEEKLRDDRQQLTALHRRLKQRHAAHRKATEHEMRQREDQLAQERAKLESERTALNEARLRFNGEAELGRRQLQDGWDELRRGRKQWEEKRSREDAEHRRRARELTEAERGLGEQWQAWQQMRQALEAEAEGLESRIRNLRRKVQEQEQEAQLSGVAPVAAPVASEAMAIGRTPAPLTAPEREQLAALDALAAQLADQRLHVLEQAERLARAREEWRAGEAAALAELEAAGHRLQDREAQLEPRERTLAEAENDCRRRGESAAQLQAQLEGWQARLTTREAAWESDRQALLANVGTREAALRRHVEEITELRHRWTQRRKKELATLRGELQRCGAARRQYASLWEECLNHAAALERQQRAWAEQTLALEQLRLELIGRAPDSAAAEKRLERLRRRCAAPTAAARRNLDRERQALDAESKRLRDWAHKLDKQTEGLAAREAELGPRLSEWEQNQVDAAAGRAQLQTQIEALTVQRNGQQREAQVLRDEVERLARLLIDDGPTLLPVGQAA